MRPNSRQAQKQTYITVSLPTLTASGLEGTQHPHVSSAGGHPAPRPGEPLEERVCAACFDELAEKGGFAYRFEDIQVTSWSDCGVLPSRRGLRRRNSGDVMPAAARVGRHRSATSIRTP
jgi:hypothetical protein